MGLGSEAVEVDVGLRAAIVVGVAGGGVVAAHAPFETIGPAVGIVIIAVGRIDGIESHESLEINASCPDIRLIDLLARVVGDAEQGVGMFFEIMVVDLDESLEYLGTGLKLLGSDRYHREHGHGHKQAF